LPLPYFNLTNAVLLFFAATLAGALNAVAGGGSFILFPTLLFTGVPPVPANATNTVALWTGLGFSGGAFRRHLNVERPLLISLVSVSLLGGVVGAMLLLRTPGHTFLRILPWLMLSATLLFIFGGKLTRSTAAPAVRDSHPPDSHTPDSRTPDSHRNDLAARDLSAKAIIASSCLQLLVAIYGGYFGGGMGFVILAMLTALGMADIHQMNALKVVLSTATNGVAVIIFILKHAVYWPQALVMICGAALGGYFGAHYSLRLQPARVRWFVIAVGASMTVYFFVRGH
jgi:uncharacterized membrane protein YfcA